MTKRTNFNKWPENMFVCLKKHLPRPLETGPCNHLASFGKPEKAKKQLGHQNTWAQQHTYGQSVFGVGSGTMPKFARSLFACSEFVPSSHGVRSEFVRSSSGVCPEFVRSSFGVRSEFVRSSFGVRSEFVRSSFGVCSEFVRSSFGVCSEFVRSLFGVRSEFVRSEFVRSWFTGNLGPLRNAY